MTSSFTYIPKVSCTTDACDLYERRTVLIFLRLQLMTCLTHLGVSGGHANVDRQQLVGRRRMWHWRNAMEYFLIGLHATCLDLLDPSGLLVDKYDTVGKTFLGPFLPPELDPICCRGDVQSTPRCASPFACFYQY